MKLKLIILPLCLIALHAFGFEGTIRQNISNFNGSHTDVTMVWTIAGRQCRIDLATKGKDPGRDISTVLLMDPATQMITSYSTAAGGDKVYIQVPASSITGDANVIVTKTTESRKIQGYTCEKWIIATGGAVYDVWITRDIDFDAGLFKDFFKSGAEMQALAQQGVKGFPMLTESHNGANAGGVDKVAVQPVANDAFSIPAGYTLFAQEPSTPAKAGK